MRLAVWLSDEVGCLSLARPSSGLRPPSPGGGRASRTSLGRLTGEIVGFVAGLPFDVASDAWPLAVFDALTSEDCVARGAQVRAYDPEATQVARGLFKNRVHYARNAYDAAKGADALLIVTEWNEFREPDFAKIKKLLKKPVIFDGRNQYDPVHLKNEGFSYYSIGRAPT